MADTPLGRFCWYELLTADPSAAPAFYGPLTGWGTMPFEGGGMPYTMWTNGDKPVGGLLDLPQEAIDGGAPPHWLAYVSTPDVGATVIKAKDLGGTVLADLDIPSVGSVAVIADPQGAVFAAFQPDGDTPGHDEPMGLGEVSWHELATDDREAAWDFYSALFGWQKTDQFDMGEAGTYQMFGRGAHPIGGIYNRPEGMPVCSWIYYVSVTDINEATEKVKEMGGTILNGPMEVPGGDWGAQCMDPQGAAFALHTLATG
jgi:predicted enzyme related to lactoylglutathione lyase